MTLDVPEVRPPVLSAGARQDLERYRRFRHLVRNAYGFELDWARLEPLLDTLPGAWTLLHQDLSAFLGFLAAAE